MKTPADRTAKRISIAEWFARYDLSEVLKASKQPRPQLRVPADRTAIRT